MKKTSILIIGGFIALCVIGWLSLGTQIVSGNNKRSEYIEQADDWVEKGLYQRAIKNYELAIEEKEDQKLYEKINKAYQLRYEEAEEETLDDYMEFLEKAVQSYPANKELIESYIKIYYSQSEYESLYNCLSRSVKEGYTSENVEKMLLISKYAFSLKRSEFSGLKQSNGDLYTAARNEGWNIYSIESGYVLANEYKYVSQCNEDGIFVVTGKDSRIMDSDGMVLGIFKEKVTDAGMLADGLLPACIDGKYKYYNDLGEEQFGDYEMASCFQDDTAAVKKEGKWYLIDNKGKVKSDAYDEIVLDYFGRYMVDNVIVAKSGGKYGFYDANMKLKTSLDCSDIDCYTVDGTIAICKDDKWGFVDSSGKVIIEPKFENAKSFSNGLAAVMKDGKWGFINADGIIVIDCEYADTGYMNELGVCPIRIILPEDNVKENNEDESKEPVIRQEIWKLLELELGIKED